MTRHYYTADELAFVKLHSDLPRRELHEKFCKEFGREDITVVKLKSLCKEKRWFNGRSCVQKSKLGREHVTYRGLVKISVKNDKPGRPLLKFVFKHRLLWEQTHGPIPKGMILKCKGDPGNPDPSNWDLVWEAMLPRLNGMNGKNGGIPYSQVPSELQPTILAVAKLEHELREKRKSKKEI